MRPIVKFVSTCCECERRGETLTQHVSALEAPCAARRKVDSGLANGGMARRLSNAGGKFKMRQKGKGKKFFPGENHGFMK